MRAWERGRELVNCTVLLVFIGVRSKEGENAPWAAVMFAADQVGYDLLRIERQARRQLRGCERICTPTNSLVLVAASPHRS